MYKLENKTVKGLSPLTINKTAENKMKVFPHGYTEQATREGYNLLKITEKSATINGLTFTINNDGSILVNGTSTADTTFVLNSSFVLESDKSYYMSGCNGGSWTTYMFRMTDTTWTQNTFNYNGFTLYKPINADRVRATIQVKPNVTMSNVIFKPMISVKKDIPFEQYGVSPSPDYPSRIRNVGDNINLFDKDNANILNDYYINSAGNVGIKSGSNQKILYIPVKKNTTYTVSKILSSRFRLFTYTGYIYGKTITNFKISDNATSLSISTGNDTTLYIMYMANDSNEQEILDSIKIEEGSIATPYTPYGCGSIDYLARNKNLAFLEFSNKVRGYGNGNLTNSDIYDTYKAIVEENTKYTVSFVGNDNNVSNLCYFDKSMNYIKGNPFNSNNPRILTTPQNCKYITLAVMNTATNFMIEKGNTKTEYIENKEQNIHIPLNKGQVIHKGDYLAEDGIHQVRKTLIINGTENWEDRPNFNDCDRFVLSTTIIPVNSKGLCNYFKVTNSVVNDIGYMIFNNGNQITVNFSKKGTTSLKQFKAYLAEQYANGTPVTIEYELAKEIVIPYTTEQEYVLNHIYSYEETTNIDIISEFETEIDVEYTPQFLQEIKDKFIKGPTFGRIHITDTNEDFTQDNYLKDFSVSELRFVPDKGLFGGCVAKKVDVNFNNVNKQFSIQDKEFEAYLGVDYEDERYEIKYGTFIVQHPETEDTTDNTSFTALDYMIKFNQKYIDYVTYPCTLRDIAESICNQAGITLAEEKFRNEDFIVENNQFVNGENLRQVLQGIALSAFSWARVDENNELHFDLNQKEDIDIELTPNEYYNLSKDDYEYGPINRIIIRDSQIEGENITIDDEESITKNGIIELVIEDNPFAYTQEKREQLIEAGKELFGFRYMPINDVSLIGLAFLNTKDKIRFKTLDGEVFDTYLFDHTINYNGVILDNVQSKALTKTETKYIYKPDITQAIKNTQIIVDKANQTINQIIEKQDEQSSQLVNIETDLSGVHTTIQDNKKDIEEKINEIEQTIEGTKQTLTYKGGNNIFYYAKEFWNNGTEDGIANLNEYTDTEIQQKSISGNGYIINKGTSEQKNVVKNDTYTISFTYKKLIDLATGYVNINGTRINLTSTSWKEEVITEIIDTNTIDIKIVSDTANAFKIFDLMGAIGNEKQVWTQNPNETRTDTVTIGRGIQVNSSTKNTYARFDADGNRIYNSSTNEVVTELTDKGVDTDKVTADVGQVGGILIQVIDGQTWFSSLL